MVLPMHINIVIHIFSIQIINDVIPYCYICIKVWPGVLIMLCLWDVRKTWKDNAVQKIKDQILHVQILKVVEDIMYSDDLIQREASVIRAKLKIAGMQDNFSRASDFIHYFEET